MEGSADQLAPVVVDLGDAAKLRHLAGLRDAPRGDGRHVISGIAIRHELHVAHDEARADRADAIMPIGRPRRLMIQIEMHKEAVG